ncbi:MAG TPA: cell division protein FtsL [Bacilli bacterium]|jgi:cell division protein FtsL|nr:cell division protein FtsL [Bacilli bacterium]HPZ23967.1 cell division protein FtsL [Bacilli bacterium]HQC83689.1 cell division protein FtsL [Bacilli bacterium]
MKKTTKMGPKIHGCEKVFITIIVILMILSPIVVVYTRASLAASNIEVEKMKSKISDQENVNSSLSMQVDELASLSNIQNIASTYGLSYNNDNIIVIK